ncbi:MAG TPA: DNA replication/repair protein RecF [Candidatus Anoxymicrobiaceae bacterium]
MIIESLLLENFRNYARQEIGFSEGRNVITGRNAQGKSNLLESIYFLSHLRSNRAPRLRELIMDGQERSTARGTVRDGDERMGLKVEFGQNGRSVELNGQKLSSAAKARGILKCVLFSPEDLYIVKGDPGRRREFLDETMEELGPVPASLLNQYRHVLRQRNALLKKWEEQGQALQSAMAPWTEALVKVGAAILVQRARMLEGMAPILAEAYKDIAGEEIELQAAYQATAAAQGDEEEVSRSLMEAISRSSGEEKRARTTLVGPHRDDVQIELGGRTARFAASQGEQRTIAFCLRVAQKKYLFEQTGKMPVLLLDDVLSELDEGRRARVLEQVGMEGQAIITTTELPGSLARAGDTVFLVESGKVTVEQP